jgi:hypothetical protein
MRREYRHFIDAKGVTCDVELISQSMQDLDRKLRVMVEKPLPHGKAQAARVVQAIHHGCL